MSQVHQFIQQSGELVFCDSIVLIHYYFVISISYACGGLPLGRIITSDEHEETVTQDSQLLQQKVLPEEAFYKHGIKEGPALNMTDDSNAERNAYGHMHNYCYVVPIKLLTTIIRF